MTTQAKVLEILSRISGRHGLPAPDESLFDSGFLDSFALADLISALESEFKIRIPDSDLSPRKFESVSQILSYLEARC